MSKEVTGRHVSVVDLQRMREQRSPYYDVLEGHLAGRYGRFANPPMGASIYSWIKSGELKGQGSSISEGIGQGRVTGNLDGATFGVDESKPRRVVLEVLRS